MPVDMTLVTVDEAIWKAEFSPSRHLDGSRKRPCAFRSIGWTAILQDRALHRQRAVFRKGDSRRGRDAQAVGPDCSGSSPRWESTSAFCRWRSASCGCRSCGSLASRWTNFLLSLTLGPAGLPRRRRLARGPGSRRQAARRIFRASRLWPSASCWPFCSSRGIDRFLRARSDAERRRHRVGAGVPDRLRHRRSQLRRRPGHRRRLRRRARSRWARCCCSALPSTTRPRAWRSSRR